MSTNAQARPAACLAAPRLEQQLIPGIGLLLQLAEPLPQGLQPPPAHAAFLQPPLGTPHQDVEFPLLGEELDRDRRPHRLPGLRQERLLQPRQAAPLGVPS